MLARGAERLSSPPEPVVLRCPECGRRVTAACPEHGAIAKLAPDNDAPPASAPALVEIAGYDDITFVARGGFGTVYVARPRGEARRVAIKVARQERPFAEQRLMEEIRVLSDIGPPHVPAVIARAVTRTGAPCFIMEYMGSATLAARLTDLPAPLPPEEALDIAILIVRAVAAVHERGYVHRDLKPENIFIRPCAAGGEPSSAATLIDFGLVVTGDDPGAGTGDISGERAILGTTDYMSPEQLEGEVNIDVRSDIYAIGILLHELFTGRSPFFGPRAVVREKHLSHRPPRLVAIVPDSGIVAAVDDVAARCLAKDRNERFPSAKALLRALTAARDAADVPAAPSSRAHSRRFVPPADKPPESRAFTEAKQLTCAVIFFDTSAAPTVVLARLKAVGGQVAYSAGGRYAAVFVQELSDNPAERARLAAGNLLRSGLCARVRMDLATVTAQVRRDGSRRFLNPALASADHYPSSSDPEIVIAPAAAAVLPGAGDDLADEPVTNVTGDLRSIVASPPPVPLLGRDPLLNTILDSAHRTALGEGPAIVVVAGDTGTGKSALWREITARLTASGPKGALFSLRAREPLLGDVDPTLSELVRWASSGSEPFSERGGAAPNVLAAILAQSVSEKSPSTAGEVSRGASPQAVRALGVAPGALRSAITSAVGEALRRRSAKEPLFILLDDAHAAGDVVLAALEYATAAESGLPIWVCVVARPNLLQDHATWGDRAARRETHTLGPLDPESAEQLCRRLLLPAESVPVNVVRSLVTRAAATPLLLVELVRGLHRGGLIRRSPKGESYYLAADELDRLPDLPLVEWLAQREVLGLAPALRDHARLIALLGDDVTEAEIGGVVRAIDDLGGGSEFPLDTGVATRRLAASGVILQDTGGYVRYRQALVRQAFAHEAPDVFRRVVHEAAVSFYRTAYELPNHLRLSRLASHAAAAGLTEEAVRTFLLLADQARNWHAYLEAERLYSRALEQQPISKAERAAAHRGRGLMRYRLTRYHDALADFAAARAHAEETGDTMTAVSLLLDEATALDWMDDFATSEARVREAEARAPESASALFRAALLLGLGRSAARFSRNEEAARLLESAAVAAERLGDEAYETRVISLLLLGFVLPAINRAGDAERVLETVVSLCEAHGDKLHLGGALNQRGMLRAMARDRTGMVADLQRVIAIAQELGQVSMELIAEFNLGEFSLLMGNSEAAAPHIARVRALDVRLTGHPGRAVVALLEARLHLFRGDLDSSAAMISAIRQHQAEMAARKETDKLLIPSDNVLCTAIELSAARVIDEAQWQALEAQSEQVSFGQERIEIVETRAVTLARAGLFSEARAHLERAISLTSSIPNVMLSRLERRMAELPS